jgi:predicted O-linked N-acetylglucosamine transferase (SPINDLY family)
MDIYINPTRRGGGTSAVEALSKGIPVITVNYGKLRRCICECRKRKL